MFFFIFKCIYQGRDIFFCPFSWFLAFPFIYCYCCCSRSFCVLLCWWLHPDRFQQAENLNQKTHWWWNVLTTEHYLLPSVEGQLVRQNQLSPMWWIEMRPWPLQHELPLLSIKKKLILLLKIHMCQYCFNCGEGSWKGQSNSPGFSAFHKDSASRNHTHHHERTSIAWHRQYRKGVMSLNEQMDLVLNHNNLFSCLLNTVKTMFISSPLHPSILFKLVER